MEVARSDFDDLLLGKELPEEKNPRPNQKNKKGKRGKGEKNNTLKKEQQEIRPDNTNTAPRDLTETFETSGHEASRLRLARSSITSSSLFPVWSGGPT